MSKSSHVPLPPFPFLPQYQNPDLKALAIEEEECISVESFYRVSPKYLYLVLKLFALLEEGAWREFSPEK